MSESRLALYISITALITLLVVVFFRNTNSQTEGRQKPLSVQQLINDSTFLNRNARTLPLPTSMEFAGEEVPLDIPDVLERLDRELHINTYWHNNTIFLFKRANRWFPVIEPILEENGIPDDFKYLALIESGLENVQSYAGAVGFWQLLKGTAREKGLEVSRDVDERYHVVKATEAACSYLNQAYRKFGNWSSVAASYNRGMNGLARAMENQKKDDYYRLMLNTETSRYVFRVLAIKLIFESPSSYGFNISEEHLYTPYQIKKDTIRSTTDMVDYAISQNIDYKTLKIYNPWLRDDKLRVRSTNYYVIDLPN